MSTVNIGASPEGIDATHRAVMEILTCGQDQKTIRAALTALGTLCRTSHVNLSGLQVFGDTTHHNHAPPPAGDDASDVIFKGGVRI